MPLRAHACVCVATSVCFQDLPKPRQAEEYHFHPIEPKVGARPSCSWGMSLPPHTQPLSDGGGRGLGNPCCPRELQQPFPSCHLTLAESTRGWWPPALVHPQPLQFGLHSTVLTCLIFTVEHGQRDSLIPHRARPARSSTKMLIFCVSISSLCGTIQREDGKAPPFHQYLNALFFEFSPLSSNLPSPARNNRLRSS